jgi:protein-disulfide isomerase
MSKARFLFTLAAAAATLALPAASSVAQRGGRAAPARDWTQSAARTAEGGVRIGNPNARLKLVEYLSLTCPHCAEFAHESSTPLYNRYVRGGEVSVEYRNFTLNGIDVAASMLARCAAPRAYFNLSHALLASQRTWMGRAQNLTAAQRAELQGLQGMAQARRLLTMLGLDAVAARHGVTARMRQTCIGQASLNGLQTLQRGGQRLGVTGTPTFFLNGRMLETNSWAGIEPLLRGR